MLEEEDETEKKKAQIYDCLSRLGLFLIVVGFVVQILGNLKAGS